jgi:hypothetical protein
VEAISQQHRLGRDIVIIGLSHDNLSTVPPRLLDDQSACPAGDTVPTPGWYHGIADLHSPIRPGRTVKSNVTDNYTVQQDLMQPPRGRFLERARHRSMCGDHHGDRIEAVGQRILRVPSRPLWPIDRCGAQTPREQLPRNLDWQRHQPQIPKRRTRKSC